MKNTRILLKNIAAILVATSTATCAFSQNPNIRIRRAADPYEPVVHDPVMAKEGNTYHIFCTGQGISHLVSADMKKWTQVKPVFATSPAWVNDYLKDFRGHIWAPDVLFYQGRYHLFYSCSAFAKNTSVIGHASTTTLDTTGVWVDHGAVLQSVPNRDMFNAIDPNIIVDENGTPWMNFGSFWDGIKLVRMKKDLSAVEQPEEWYSLCRRNRTFTLSETDPGDGAVEAPFIFKKGKYYYLFASYDYCCKGLNSNYYVVVGRSEKVTGPYLDMEGRSMATGGGTTVLKGDEKWAAAGHCAVYSFDNTDYLIAHGYSRQQNGISKLLVRVIEWDAQGWPVLSR